MALPPWEAVQFLLPLPHVQRLVPLAEAASRSHAMGIVHRTADFSLGITYSSEWEGAGS